MLEFRHRREGLGHPPLCTTLAVPAGCWTRKPGCRCHPAHWRARAVLHNVCTRALDTPALSASRSCAPTGVSYSSGPGAAAMRTSAPQAALCSRAAPYPPRARWGWAPGTSPRRRRRRRQLLTPARRCPATVPATPGFPCLVLQGAACMPSAGSGHARSHRGRRQAGQQAGAAGAAGAQPRAGAGGAHGAARPPGFHGRGGPGDPAHARRLRLPLRLGPAVPAGAGEQLGPEGGRLGAPAAPAPCRRATRTPLNACNSAPSGPPHTRLPSRTTAPSPRARWSWGWSRSGGSCGRCAAPCATTNRPRCEATQRRRRARWAAPAARWRRPRAGAGGAGSGRGAASGGSRRRPSGQCAPSSVAR